MKKLVGGSLIALLMLCSCAVSPTGKTYKIWENPYDPSLYVKVEVATENQCVVRHGPGWLEYAQKQAEEHCAKYGKSAIMANTNCGNPMSCVTIWNCKQGGE